jgi:hypothetical protein
MCCSVSPNVEVRFSDTILYAAEVFNLENELVHVLGYQNRAQNNVGRFSTWQNGVWDEVKNAFTSTFETTGNAMILPFPAVPRSMSKANILDTENCPNILKNIAQAVTPEEGPLLFLSNDRSAQSAPVVEIFEAAGIYTVVLAQDARAIPDVLDQVAKEKRPRLNPELFEAYAEWYPDWTIALCCFNNNDLQEALPMLWWYEPMNPEQLFLPALDGHTGDMPRLDLQVSVDHTLAVGSAWREKNKEPETQIVDCRMCLTENLAEYNFCGGCGSPLELYGAKRQNNNWFGPKTGYQNVDYTDREAVSDQIKPYLMTQVMGGVYKKHMRNGDFVCRIDEVRKGIWNPVRTWPPTAYDFG